jgi:hypothetical protein
MNYNTLEILVMGISIICILILWNLYKLQKKEISSLKIRPKKLDYSFFLLHLKNSKNNLFSPSSLQGDFNLNWDEVYSLIGYLTSSGYATVIHSLECEHCDCRNEVDSYEKFQELKVCKMCYKPLNKDGWNTYVHYKLTPQGLYESSEMDSLAKQTGDK